MTDVGVERRIAPNLCFIISRPIDLVVSIFVICWCPQHMFTVSSPFVALELSPMAGLWALFRPGQGHQSMNCVVVGDPAFVVHRNKIDE